MAVTAATFKVKFSKFANVADDTVTAWIATAELENDETYFGTLYDRAVELHTAHLLMQEEMAAAGRNGPLTSTSIDRESWSFASQGTGLESTPYGIQYQKLYADCFTGGFLTSTTGRY